MRRLPTVVVLLALAGCSQDDPLPHSCTEGPRAVERALAGAPAQVRLDGTPLSHCLTSKAAAAELQTIGATFVPVAEHLADAARRDPGGPAALRLGYLIGAVRRGASGSPGLHAELVRRLEQEAAADTHDPAFRRGEQAGRSNG